MTVLTVPSDVFSLACADTVMDSFPCLICKIRSCETFAAVSILIPRMRVLSNPRGLRAQVIPTRLNRGVDKEADLVRFGMHQVRCVDISERDLRLWYDGPRSVLD